MNQAVNSGTTPPHHVHYDYMDVIRAIGCILVVLTHVTAKFMDFPVVQRAWLWANLFNSTTRAAVPLFIMISGALFLDPARTVTMKLMLTKYVRRLAIALVEWNALYAVIVFIQSHNWQLAIRTLVLGPYHLWFLYVMIGCYLATPFIKPALADRHLLNWAIGIGLVFVILPTTLRLFLPPTNLLFPLINAFQVNIFAGFLFYFVLGYALSRVIVTRLYWWLGVSAAVVGTGMIFWQTQRLSLLADHLIQLFQANMSLFVLMQTVGIFIIVKGLSHHSPARWVLAFSRVSLPIYLVHPIFLGAMMKLHLVAPDLLHLAIVYVIVLALSFGFGWLYAKTETWLSRTAFTH